MGSLVGLSCPENGYNLHFHKDFPFLDANDWTAWLQLYYYIQDFFSLSLPRGLLLLLGIRSNKNEQAVKPNDLDGITSNLLQTADVHATFLSSNPHFNLVPALQASFVWKGGICFTTQPGSIEFLTCLCSVSTKRSDYIQQNCKIRCHK